MMNKLITLIKNDTFWTALGSIATFTASGIALWQSNENNRRKLKLNINYAVIPELSKEYLVMNINNICRRDIIIKEWSISLKNKKRIYLIIDNNRMPGSIEPKYLPYKLNSDHEINLYFDYSLFKEEIKKQVKENNLFKYKKIRFVIKDSLNKKYQIRSKSRMKDILMYEHIKI